MNTLQQDLTAPIMQMERAWLRRPLVALSIPVITILGIVVGAILGGVAAFGHWINKGW